MSVSDIFHGNGECGSEVTWHVLVILRMNNEMPSMEDQTEQSFPEAVGQLDLEDVFDIKERR